jgi:hypothetical protein
MAHGGPESHQIAVWDLTRCASKCSPPELFAAPGRLGFYLAVAAMQARLEIAFDVQSEPRSSGPQVWWLGWRRKDLRRLATLDPGMVTSLGFCRVFNRERRHPDSDGARVEHR